MSFEVAKFLDGNNTPHFELEIEKLEAVAAGIQSHTQHLTCTITAFDIIGTFPVSQQQNNDRNLQSLQGRFHKEYHLWPLNPDQ